MALYVTCEKKILTSVDSNDDAQLDEATLARIRANRLAAMQRRNNGSKRRCNVQCHQRQPQCQLNLANQLWKPEQKANGPRQGAMSAQLNLNLQR